MLRILVEVDKTTAGRCACACARPVLPLVPSGEGSPRGLLDACEAWLDRSTSADVVLDAIMSCAQWSQDLDDSDYMSEEIAEAAISAALISGVNQTGEYSASYPYSSVTPEHSANALAMHKTGIKISIRKTRNPLPPSMSLAKSEFLAGFCDVIRGIVPVAPKIADVVGRPRK